MPLFQLLPDTIRFRQHEGSKPGLTEAAGRRRSARSRQFPVPVEALRLDNGNVILMSSESHRLIETLTHIAQQSTVCFYKASSVAVAQLCSTP
jgi:hypothetical protein